MAWADRTTLIIGIIWALLAFILMGGTQRPDISAFTWLYTFALFWGTPLAILWVLLRLILGNRGALRRY